MEDAVTFQALCWSYWEHPDDDPRTEGEGRKRNLPGELGLRSRVENNDKTLPSITKGEAQCLVNCMVLRKEIAPNTELLKLLSAYLGKRVPIKALFGEKDRRVKKPWQTEDAMASMAKHAYKNIRRKDGSKLNVSKEFGSMNLFQLLADIFNAELSDQRITKEYRLTPDTASLQTLRTMIKDECDYIDKRWLSSASAWYHAYHRG